MPVIPALVLDYAQRPPQAWWKILEKLIEVPHQLSATLVAEAVHRLVNHHDALRMRLVKRKDDYGNLKFPQNNIYQLK